MPSLPLCGLLLALVIGLGPGLARQEASHAAAAAAQTDYPLFDYDPMRSGQNPTETHLTSSTVGGLTRLWHISLPDPADSSPIELAQVPLAGGRRANLLYITSKSGATTALDAANGRTLWSVRTTQGESLRDYQITTSSPAADPNRAWIYAASPDGKVHKLGVATGVEAAGWPIVVTLHQQDEKIASALNVVGHTLLVTTSGYIGDFGHYEGHLLAIDTNTRSIRVFNSLCSGIPHLLAESAGSGPYCPAARSGIWARGGAVVDQMPGSPTNGHIFIATGNGLYDGKSTWGDSVLRLAVSASALTLVDAYTPTNQADLNTEDADLGSTTPILLPRQLGQHPWLALQGGKDDRLRLVDRANLSGQGGPGHLGGELASIPMPQGGDMFTTGIATRDSQGQTWIYVATGGGVVALRLSVASGRPQLQVVWRGASDTTSPILAGGVLFVAGNAGIRAVDPLTGLRLWESTAPRSGGNIGGVHWQSPIVVNGMLYMADNDGGVTAYGAR